MNVFFASERITLVQSSSAHTGNLHVGNVDVHRGTGNVSVGVLNIRVRTLEQGILTGVGNVEQRLRVKLFDTEAVKRDYIERIDIG